MTPPAQGPSAHPLLTATLCSCWKIELTLIRKQIGADKCLISLPTPELGVRQALPAAAAQMNLFLSRVILDIAAGQLCSPS